MSIKSNIIFLISFSRSVIFIISYYFIRLKRISVVKKIKEPFYQSYKYIISDKIGNVKIFLIF
nr:MAG TPA: hypothetical protein [Caudoviricetes sp.]